MSDEKSQQQTSTESTVAGAAKTGKAISNIAKGAAAGGAHGAAIEAGKSSAKWLIPLIAAVLLPLILVAMLPSIIFGSLLGDGTDSPNGISNDEVLVQNKKSFVPVLHADHSTWPGEFRQRRRLHIQNRSEPRLLQEHQLRRSL